MRLLVTLVVLLGGGGGLASPAAARSVQPCPTKSVEVVAEGRTAVVVSKEGVYWGCLRKTNRGFVLGEDEVDGTGSFRVRGRFVSVVWRACSRYPGEDCSSTSSIEIWDLRRAKRTLLRTFGGGGDDVEATVDALSLGPDGGAMAVLRVAPNREVWMFCAREARRLEASTDVAPRLERDGRLVWAYSQSSGRRILGHEPRCTRRR